MDFFRAQEQARRCTALLVVYFTLAVALITAAVYLVLAMGASGREPVLRWWQPGLFAVSVLGTLALVGGGSLYKIAALARGGGAVVAGSLGGRLVRRETTDSAERRLLNVVDEIAIASGVPVPPVYLLEDEPGINAFAAGTTTGNAVIAVTRGTLEQLNRDELQGVVAHEFSHLLNGDMRLNLRLIGVLHGILLLALLGRGLLRGAGRSRGKNSGGAVMFGLALLIIGYIGVFFGRLIQAAVSRQREYLADASAVQFTRNPAGIGGALKKIADNAGSRILHPQAEGASHLFFGEAVGSLFGWFATHPPIGERIRRIDPSFNPQLAAAPAKDSGGSAAHTIPLSPQAFAAAAGQLQPRHVSCAGELIASLPAELVQDLHEPAGARAVIYGLLLARDPAVAHGQLSLIDGQEGRAIREIVEAHAAWAHTAGPRVRLPVVDLALPALAQLEHAQRARFLELTTQLVRADRRLDLFEYALEHILMRQLKTAAGAKRSQIRGARAIQADCALLLSAIAYAGNRGDARQRAFAQAAALAPMVGPLDLIPRDQVVLSRLNGALARLTLLPPRFKRRLVEACAAAVSADQTVSIAEGELLRAICESLEVPMPPLLAA